MSVSVRGVLVCYRCTQTGPITAEWTYWDSRGQARQARAELTPCGPLCIGVHAVVGVGRGPDRKRKSSFRASATAERRLSP
jgi:hypothetical protein